MNEEMSKQLMMVGIEAYRAGRFDDAIELLRQGTTNEKPNWLIQMYLGMAYHKAGRLVDAASIFDRLSKQCPDQDVQKRAKIALALVENDASRRFTQLQPVKRETPA
jgi:thioredoxin-like negative regulator of GroEL